MTQFMDNSLSIWIPIVRMGSSTLIFSSGRQSARKYRQILTWRLHHCCILGKWSPNNICEVTLPATSDNIHHLHPQSFKCLYLPTVLNWRLLRNIQWPSFFVHLVSPSLHCSETPLSLPNPVNSNSKHPPSQDWPRFIPRRCLWYGHKW